MAAAVASGPSEAAAADATAADVAGAAPAVGPSSAARASPQNRLDIMASQTTQASSGGEMERVAGMRMLKLIRSM